MQQSPNDNIRLWRGKREIQNKYKSAILIWLVIYLLGYGWVIFSKEESLIKNRSGESVSTFNVS